MAGFLTRLDKKSNKASSAGSEAAVRPSASALLPKMPAGAGAASETKVVQSKQDLGSAEDLLKELNQEGGALRSKPATAPPPPAAPNTNISNLRVVKKEPAAGDGAAFKDSTKKDGKAESAKTRLLDEALPWWLTDPVAASPQVDILVPASRLSLNDFITDNMSREDLVAAIRKAVNVTADRLSAEVRFSSKDIQDSIQELISLMMGKGPLQALYDDPAVTDVYMDGHDSIKCVRRGQALETPFRFRNEVEYESYITGMLQSVDRVLNMSSPIVDCVLNDQWRSRINAVHSSLRDGRESSLVIRVPRLQQISFYDLLRTKTLPSTVAAWLSELVSSGEANILVMGPTGSGKTTLTTALLSAVGSDERICTIEDVPEIFVPTAHLEKLVSRPENSQGEGAIGMEQLLRAALRRAPHRIVVGEIRDREGPLFLKALETGHAGSVATIHAENPRDGLWRLLDVVAAIEKAPQESIMRRIGRALHILIVMKKVNGRPCLVEIAEVRPPVSGEFVVKQLLKFESEEGGKRFWRISATESEWLAKMEARGLVMQAGQALLPFHRDIERYREDLE